MSKQKTRVFSIVFVALLALSGASFGFLVGQSHKAQAERTNTEMQTLTNQVQLSANVVAKGAKALRLLLVK